MGANWSEHAAALFGDWTCLWQSCKLDYQGNAQFLASKDGKVVYMEWSYGSCSGCDPWGGMPKEEVRRDFERLAMVFKDVATFEAWVRMLQVTGQDHPDWVKMVREHNNLAEPPLQEVEVGAVYKNTKTGCFYQLTDIGRHTETGEAFARYVAVFSLDVLRRSFKARLTETPYYTPLTRFAGKRVDGRWYFERAKDAKMVTS